MQEKQALISYKKKLQDFLHIFYNLVKMFYENL